MNLFVTKATRYYSCSNHGGKKEGNGYNFSFIKPANTDEDLNPVYVFV